ncbi:MAG: riboflavin kinase, partial [Thermodesulfobacteriota bacterium]|nr:riboflavin kinase [Thermodesulfobacteriota bacterium]
TKDFLGRYYSISGVVVHGEQRGREIGFPTANLNTEFEFLPMNGVYVTYINLGNNKLEGITNIGFRPTFGKKDLLIESHIFDFNQSIYNQEITIEFINRIRSEKKFDSVEKLIENINKDVEHGRRVFKSKND